MIVKIYIIKILLIIAERNCRFNLLTFFVFMFVDVVYLSLNILLSIFLSYRNLEVIIYKIEIKII